MYVNIKDKELDVFLTRQLTAEKKHIKGRLKRANDFKQKPFPSVTH